MGYRISLYRCPKEDVDAIRNITDEDVEKNYEIFDVLRKDQIKYDTLAHVLDTGTEEEDGLCSRIFNNELEIECDLSFYTISREQLKRIIEKIRSFNYEWQMGNTVNYDKQEIGEKLTGKFSWEKATFEEGVRSVCIDARHKAEMWNSYWVDDDDGSKHYTNVDLTDNKWWITNAWTYEYCIFNFIHILKCFDWEHDYLVALGG